MPSPDTSAARGNQEGMSLIEVLVSFVLVMVVVYALLGFANAAHHATRRNGDKQFAVQKAVSMLEELKSLVELQSSPATMLDAVDDGASTKPILTTDASVTDPATPGSDNIALGPGNWKYLRQISVSLLPGTTDPNVRLVSVRVYRNRDDNGDGSPDSLAEVAGVLRTAGGNYPPTQVHDIFALAIENVPGWWVYMANLIPFVQSAIQNVESRNPGLEFRVHWITKLSYGRDMLYRPQINAAVDSLQSIDNVYFYPGKMPTTEAVSFYYPPDNFTGHILQDGTDKNGYSPATNPFPYALADTYNNAMRYPDELALFNDRLAAGLESDDKPTLRILLERLYQDPDRFRNAIFINLHGELFPFPPIRNYSDPAKDPANFPNVRVVTHPERLRYPASSTYVKLRVYSYRTDPDVSGSGDDRDWLGQGHPGGVPITVTLKGVHWTPTSGAGDIVAIGGGTDQDGSTGADPYAQVSATDTPSATGMYFTASTSGGDTIINLYNSPLKSPEVLVSGSGTNAIWTGLNAASRLYGLEYLPAPSEDFTGTGSVPTPFASNLTANHQKDGSGLCSSTSADCTPNTARWILRVPADVLPGGANGNAMLTVETRIDSTTSGTRSNAPPDLSRTYVWRGSDVWMFGDGTATNQPHLPLTERYQILGDPRHNPYADLKMPHDGSGRPAQDALGMGFNRYFDDFQNASFNASGSPYWKGYTYTISGQTYGVKNDGTVDNDGWKAAGSSVEIDMPRIYQIMRTVHAQARVVYTTMTGYSYYYCGLGNEIGYDAANNFSNSIPVNSKLLTGFSGNTHEQSILTDGANQGVKYIRENAAGTSYWWGLHWLGELYPDSSYSGGTGWEQTGNLPTGAGSGRFVRVLRTGIAQDLLPRGTTLVNAGRRTGPEGSTSYYWAGTSSSTFHHIPSDGTGNLQSGGTEIAARYSLPLSNGIPINRPFGTNVNDTGHNPDHFLQRPYDPVYTAAYLSQFYDHSVQTSAEGSALLSLRNANNDVQFVVVNGISMTGQSGSSFIANWSLLTLIQGFLAAGRYNPSGYANHVEQIPRVTITSPNATTFLTNPSSVPIGWRREWLRWDGQSYATSYPSGYAETSPLSYAVMYSADNGATWKYVQDGSAATPGVRAADPSCLISTSDATPSYDWATPAGSFPQGTYLIRVEAYRDNLPLHYAYHQYRAFIRRA
jgi:type II secretory pathway pseudopilin PulG